MNNFKSAKKLWKSIANVILIKLKFLAYNFKSNALIRIK